MEQSLVFLKPSTVKRGLVGRIISRFEDKGYKIKAMRVMSLTPEMVDQHYQEHVKKDFYGPLKEYALSGPIVVMVLEGDQVISVVRKLVGVTNSAEADPGTIRGDFSSSGRMNMVHASDSIESAKREIALFFPDLKS